MDKKWVEELVHRAMDAAGQDSAEYVSRRDRLRRVSDDLRWLGELDVADAIVEALVNQ